MSVNSEVVDMESQECSVSNGSDIPLYKLYSMGGVVVATIFASVLTGGMLMALNYKRLGNTAAAWKTIGFSFLALILNIVIAGILPDAFPSLLVSLPFLFAIGQAMKQFQGNILVEHLEKKGQLESNWKAFGISFVVILVVAVFFFSAIGLASGS